MPNSRTLPVFPLGTILFPDGVLPLRIFERRYLDMVRNQLKAEQPFVICGLASGREVGEAAEPYRVGTTARIVDFDSLDDGTLGITVRGEARVRLSQLKRNGDGLCIGEIEAIPEQQAERVPEPLMDFYSVIGAMQEQLGSPWADQPVQPDNALWLSGRMAELLPWPLAFKQELLEEGSGLIRLKRLLENLPEQN